MNGEYAGFKADIASATDYYPFGMEMPGRSFSSGSSRFGFNGKEDDREVAGQQDYGFRIYDPNVWFNKGISVVKKGTSSVTKLGKNIVLQSQVKPVNLSIKKEKLNSK